MNSTLLSLHAWEELRELFRIARTRIERGILLYSAGEYRDAIDSFEQARSGCAAIGDTPCVTEAITDEGMAANRVGDYANALQLTQQAVPEWRRIGDQLNLGRTFPTSAIFIGASAISNPASAPTTRQSRFCAASMKSPGRRLRITSGFATRSPANMSSPPPTCAARSRPSSATTIARQCARASTWAEPHY